MKKSKNKIGVYLHIPFCDGKCPYCDFFSRKASLADMDDYTNALISRVYDEAQRLGRKADTVYFGGGTPGLLGAERLSRILYAVQEGFGLSENAEVTVEVNPTPKNLPDFRKLYRAGFNRLSMGLQSSNDHELSALGRRHTSADAERAIEAAKIGGFENISLDLMLAIPYQNEQSLEQSIRFCFEHGATHISSYLLKIEEGTQFYAQKDSLPLFDDEKQADYYMLACEIIESCGYRQYEISNFAKKGFESRHNLKYWHDEEYIGIGASAHSFVNGKRFYFPRSLKAFYANEQEYEGTGGDEQEYIMMALRLCEGLQNERFIKRFGTPIPQKYFDRAARFQAAGLTQVSEKLICFTRKGFLVSNALFAEILD